MVGMAKLHTTDTVFSQDKSDSFVLINRAKRIRLVLNTSARRVKHHGRDYLVVPVTMLVPGVLNGSKGPLYYPKEEVGKNIDAWNGMPLTLDHPVDDATGLNVSARDPGTLEKYGIGHVYRVRIDNNTGSLKGQAWFDEKLVIARDEYLIKNARPAILPRLLQGRPIELSTGLFTRNTPAANGRGIAPNGREYVAIARDYKPDHLAILPDSQGACSVRDGCGVHINNTNCTPTDPTDNARKSKGKRRKDLTGGRWVTTRSGKHFYIKGGKIVAGNPHAVKAAKRNGKSKKFDPEGYKGIPAPGEKGHSKYKKEGWRHVPAPGEKGHSKTKDNSSLPIARAKVVKRKSNAHLPPALAKRFIKNLLANLRKRKRKPSKSLDMSAGKACKILKDGSVHGHPLTKAQRGMFGAKCGQRVTSNVIPKVLHNLLTNFKGKSLMWRKLLTNLIKITTRQTNNSGNCGIGSGGFQKGNHCASGGGTLEHKATTSAHSGSNSGVSQTLKDDVASGRLRASNASNKAHFASDTALEKHHDDIADKLSTTARKLAKRAIIGMGYAGTTPETHELAAKAHTRAARRHIELDKASSGEGANYHGIAGFAHRDAATAHADTAVAMRRLAMVRNARKLGRKSRNFDQKLATVTNSDAVTPFLSEKGSTMTGKQKMVRFLTTNCDCWKGGEDVLNEMDNDRLKSLIKVARKHAEDEAIANAVRESLDESGEMDVEELTTVTANALKGGMGGSDSGGETKKKKKKKGPADCSHMEDDGDMTKNHEDETLEEFLERDDVPKFVKRLVKNQLRQEKEQTEQVVNRLKKVAKITANKAKRTLITNKLKRHEEEPIPLETLEELLIAVNEESQSRNGSRPTSNARIKPTPDDDDDSDDDDDDEKTVTNRITNYGGGGGVTNRGKRKNEEEDGEEYVDNEESDIEAMVTPEIDYSEIIDNHNKNDNKMQRSKGNN